MPCGVHRIIQGHLVYAVLISVTASSASAQDANTLDCGNNVLVDGIAYNFALLSGEKTLQRTRDTPPSVMVDELRFDVCKDLAHRDGIADADQCPTGTRACLTKTNKKSGVEDRITTVIPIAQTSILQPAYSALQSPAGLSIILHGGSYPQNASPPAAQSLNLTLSCTRDSSSDPILSSYENGVVVVQWNTSAGCPTKRDGTESDGDGNTGGGEKEGERTRGSSGIGWFFLFLFVSFVGYFVLGAYYNYNNFGATGWDLVPHRDFWRDVPYLLRDFTEHLCSTLRPGRTGASRRGYMAV